MGMGQGIRRTDLLLQVQISGNRCIVRYRKMQQVIVRVLLFPVQDL